MQNVLHNNAFKCTLKILLAKINLLYDRLNDQKQNSVHLEMIKL